jgi:hypothetical protein
MKILIYTMLIWLIIAIGIYAIFIHWFNLEKLKGG